MILLFLICILTPTGVLGGPVSGTWSAPPSALPYAQLADVPLLGNGALGLLLDAHDSESPPGVGPGRNNTLDLWLGSASMWSCRSCQSIAKGCCGAVALGGVSISLQPSFPTQLFNFSATQVTSKGILESSWILRDTPSLNSSGVFSTLSFMHPELNVVVTELSWNATGGGVPGALLVNVSTWVLGSNPTAHAGPMPTFAGCWPSTNGSGPVPCSVGGSLIAGASRAAGNVSVGGPHPVWAGLATAVWPSTATVAYDSVVDATTVWAATSLLKLEGDGSKVYLITAEAEAMSYNGADPSSAAAKLAATFASETGPETVYAISSAWWIAFWARSAVSIGDPAQTTLPEAMWWGAQVRILRIKTSATDTPRSDSLLMKRFRFLFRPPLHTV